MTGVHAPLAMTRKRASLDNDRMYAIAYNLRNVAIGVRQNDGGQQLLLRGLSTPGQGKGVF